jgi:hypothetical protein
MIQREVLAKAKGMAACLRAGDAVLQNAPMSYNGIDVFGGPWDITPALLLTYVEKIPTLPKLANEITVYPSYAVRMTWKPGELTAFPGWVWPAKRLWIWNADTDRLRLVTEETTFPPEGRDALFASATEPPACNGQ